MQEEKLLVVAFHDVGRGVAVCMKATSKIQFYVNNPEMMAGAVFYKAGSVSCFPKDTVIQPDNLFPVPYSRLGPHSVVGALPSDFAPRLASAIKASIRIADGRRTALLGRLRLQ